MCQAFVAEIVETGNKNHCVTEATHVLSRKLKEGLNLELFRNVSVQEFDRLKVLITLDYGNTSEWLKKIRILISKTAMVECCKLSLYANGLVMTIEAHEFSCIYTRVQQSLLERVLNQFRHK